GGVWLCVRPLPAAANEPRYRARRASRTMVDSNTGTVQIDGVAIGKAVGEFTDYDAMVEAIRQHAATIGLSYQVIDELSGLAEGHTGKLLADLRVKNFGLPTFLSITETLGIRAVFYVDPNLVRRMRPMWEKRDQRKAHPKRLAPVGRVTLKRIIPIAAAELG